VILKKEATVDDIRSASHARLRSKKPRRALKMRLSTCWAAPRPSPLGAILHTVEGTPDETVIEAQN
jgi:ABC-2 type transport system ATP-binding protein